MSDVVERVAQAIRSGMENSGVVSLVANGPKGEVALQQFFEVLAMDAIEAMREPTEAMVDAALFAVQPHSTAREADKSLYRAMIDAALASA